MAADVEECVGWGARLSNLRLDPETLALCLWNLDVAGMGLRDLTPLAEYPFVRHLDVSDNALDSLAPVSHAKQLRRLVAQRCGLAGMLSLPAGPRALEELDLDGNALSSLGRPGSLAPHGQLHVLSVCHNGLLDVDAIDDLRELIRLSLADNRLTRLFSAQLPRLQVLNVAGNALESLDCLPALPHLRELDASRNRIVSVAPLARLPRLAQARLARNEVASLDDVAALAHLCSLETLDLAGNPVQNQEHYRLHLLHTLPSLAELDARPIQAEERVDAANLHGADAASRRANVSFHFPRGEQDDSAVPSAASRAAEAVRDAGYWRALVERGLIGEWQPFLSAVLAKQPLALNFAAAPIGEAGLWAVARALADNPCIESLDASGCFTPTRWSSALHARFPGLTLLATSLGAPSCRVHTLVLREANIGPAEAQVLASGIASMRALESLDLARNKLGLHSTALDQVSGRLQVVSECPGLRALLSAAASCSLRHLNLEANSLDDLAARCISGWLADPACPATSLNVSSNEFGLEEGVRFAFAFRTNKRLRRLVATAGAACPLLKPFAVGQLFHCLANHNRTLCDLVLDGNAFSSFAADALALCLTRPDCQLEHLSLAHCSLSGDLVATIARGLATNRSVRALNLSHNEGLAGSPLALLLRALSSRREVEGVRLDSLALRGALWDDAGAAALGDMTRANTEVAGLDLRTDRSAGTGEHASSGLRSALSSLGALAALDMSGLALLAVDLAALLSSLRVERLESLCLGAASFDDAAWYALTELVEGRATRLRSLSIEGATLASKDPSAAVAALITAAAKASHGASLRHVSIARANLGDSEARGFLTALSGSTPLNLDSFVVDGAKFSFDGIEALMSALGRVARISAANLSLEGDAMRRVCSVLEAHESLRELILTGNPASRETIAASMLLASRAKSLQRLALPDQLGDQGMAMSEQLCLQAFTALRYASNLVHLDLGRLVGINGAVSCEQRACLLGALKECGSRASLVSLAAGGASQALSAPCDEKDSGTFEWDELTNAIAARLGVAALSGKAV